MTKNSTLAKAVLATQPLGLVVIIGICIQHLQPSIHHQHNTSTIQHCWQVVLEVMNGDTLLGTMLSSDVHGYMLSRFTRSNNYAIKVPELICPVYKLKLKLDWQARASWLKGSVIASILVWSIMDQSIRTTARAVCWSLIDEHHQPWHKEWTARITVRSLHEQGLAKSA